MTKKAGKTSEGKSQSTFSIVLKIVIAIASAIAGAIGLTSCMV